MSWVGTPGVGHSRQASDSTRVVPASGVRSSQRQPPTRSFSRWTRGGGAGRVVGVPAPAGWQAATATSSSRFMSPSSSGVRAAQAGRRANVSATIRAIAWSDSAAGR